VATYVVTTSNYNDPAFWAAIAHGTAGHMLDFSGLPESYEFSLNSDTGTISIWNGASWFTVGENGASGTDANLGGSTSVEYFSVVEGSSGDDYIDGGDDVHFVYAGGGDDTLQGGSSNDYLAGGSGSDEFDAGAGDDHIVGDRINFTASDHASASGGAATTLSVTNSADGPIKLYLVNSGGGLDYVTDIAAGDTYVAGTTVGTNWVLMDEFLYELDVIEVEGVTAFDYGADGLGDTIVAGDGDDFVGGMFGNDQIYGGEGNDSLYGGYGEDMIYGGTGHDSIAGNDGADFLSGNSGDDTLEGGAGNDIIWTGADNDSAEGGDGNDKLYGEGGADTLEGGAGDDTIWGGADGDLMKGGDDADTFMLEDNAGSDTIIGGEGGDDDDVVDATSMTGPVTVSYTGDEDGVLTDGTDTIYFQEVERLELTSQDDSVDGGASTTGINVVTGAGDDTIRGSAGDDSITTGDDDDLLILTSSGGSDTVSDFDIGDEDSDGFFNDQLDVSELSGGSGAAGMVTTADVVVTDDGSGNALLTFPEGEQLVLQGVAPASLSSQSQLYSAGVPCFTPGIRIATARGAVPVEQIRVGDLLQTADNGFQPVIWTGCRELSADDLKHNPHLRPILLNPGGVLANDTALLVSPQHRFMVNRRHLGDLGGGNEAFLRARLLQDLTPDTAVSSTRCAGVSYIHLMTERHQVIFAEGVATETFWPGPEALCGLSPQDRRELFDLFPELLLALQLRGAAGRKFVNHRYCRLARHDLMRKDLAALNTRPAACQGLLRASSAPHREAAQP